MILRNEASKWIIIIIIIIIIILKLIYSVTSMAV